MYTIRRLRLLCSVVPLLAALVSGCTSTWPVDGEEISSSEFNSYFGRPRDPRRYGLSVYTDKRGRAVFSGSNRLHSQQTADLLWEKTSPTAPVVHIRGRTDEDLPALLDTLAGESWITLAAAQEMMAEPLGPPTYPRTPEHVKADGMEGLAVLASKLKLDGLHVENTIFYLLSKSATLAQLDRGCRNPQPFLLIGQDVLRRFSFVQFDFARKATLFSTTSPYKYSPEQLIAEVPFKLYRGVPVVEGSIDGKRCHYAIDVVGDYAVSSDCAGGNEVQQLEIGDLVAVRQSCTHFWEVGLSDVRLVRLGQRFLERFLVTFDYQKNTIVFERPSNASEMQHFGFDDFNDFEDIDELDDDDLSSSQQPGANFEQRNHQNVESIHRLQRN